MAWRPAPEQGRAAICVGGSAPVFSLGVLSQGLSTGDNQRSKQNLGKPAQLSPHPFYTTKIYAWARVPMASLSSLSSGVTRHCSRLPRRRPRRRVASASCVLLRGVNREWLLALRQCHRSAAAGTQLKRHTRGHGCRDLPRPVTARRAGDGMRDIWACGFADQDSADMRT